MISTQFEPIILSDTVVVSDPCYTRGTWCHGQVTNLLPGFYIPHIIYTIDNRVSQLIVIHKSVDFSYLKGRGKRAEFTVGVDSGQAGIFCNTLYPQGECGEYDDKNSFYSKVCECTLGEGYDAKQRAFSLRNQISDLERMLTTERLQDSKFKEVYEEHLIMYKDKLKNLPKIPYYQGGTVDGKGVVSSSGYGDGSYSCYTYEKDEKVIGIRIFFI